MPKALSGMWENIPEPRRILWIKSALTGFSTSIKVANFLRLSGISNRSRVGRLDLSRITGKIPCGNPGRRRLPFFLPCGEFFLRYQQLQAATGNRSEER